MKPIVIHRWSTTRGSENPYQPPECSPLYLQGNIYGHPDFQDGDHVVTSAIVNIEGRKVTVKSGHIYRLGRPDQRWLRWLKNEGIPYDRKNPIRRRVV